MKNNDRREAMQYMEPPVPPWRLRLSLPRAASSSGGQELDASQMPAIEDAAQLAIEDRPKGRKRKVGDNKYKNNKENIEAVD